MEENERLHPGIHARMHAYLLAEFHGPRVDADEFFGLKDLTNVSSAEEPIKDNNQNDYSDDCHAATSAPSVELGDGGIDSMGELNQRGSRNPCPPDPLAFCRRTASL
jgi:hypothetical protein